MTDRELDIGMIGWSVEPLEQGRKGYAWFPVGDQDTRFRGGHKWERRRIRAAEEIRPLVSVVVINQQKEVREYGPLEATRMGYVYDDYTLHAFTTTESQYEIGTEARKANSSLPATFIADHIFLYATAAVLIRFDDNSNVQHLLATTTQYEFYRRARVLYITGSVGGGNLTINAFGKDIGVK